MKIMGNSGFGRTAVICTLLLTWTLASLRAEGQAAAGNNAVCKNSSGGCSDPTTQVMSSKALIDAFGVSQGADICATINGILRSSTFVAGTVIDARGISSTLTCAAGTSPWFDGSSYQNKAATILLPAQTITISSAWVLPGGTKIIGEGVGSTVIKACGAHSCFADDWMILFAQACPAIPCTGSTPATGISVENLTLDGNEPNNGQTSLGGILNAFSQEASYVDHVDLFQILGTGLLISGSAQNSGPYSNITYDTNELTASSATCVSIYNVGGGTRGVHGLTCRGDSSSYGQVAVYLDSSNNSIEDVSISDFNDGILVGSQGPAQSNVLLNIVGNTVGLHLPPINVVHIVNSSNAVSDLSIVGVTNLGTGLVYTVNDERTSTTLSDKNVAMYALGKSTGDGYSRFTTSPNTATWASGSGAPSNPCAAPGSLYSNTTSGAFSVCVYGTSTNAWSPVTLH